MAAGKGAAATPGRMVDALRRTQGDGALRFPARLVVVFKPQLMARLRWRLAARRDRSWAYDDRPARRIYRPAAIPDVGLVLAEIGAPALLYLLEIGVHLGLREVLLVTSAAGLRSDLAIGDHFVATQAISAAGAPPYPGVPDPGLADPDMLARLHAAGLPRLTLLPVVACSTDLFFHPQPEFWRALRPAPDVLEMEVAPVYALAAYLRFRAAAIGFVSDVLTPTGWEVARLECDRDRLRGLTDTVIAFLRT